MSEQQTIFEPLRRVEAEADEELPEAGGAVVVMRLLRAEVEALGTSGPLVEEIHRRLAALAPGTAE